MLGRARMLSLAQLIVLLRSSVNRWNLIARESSCMSSDVRFAIILGTAHLVAILPTCKKVTR